ncbi:expressed protein [Phakopsora pachyrhizi]|uniref:Expressed protein n=1 Tax=Phakopsora pachyrhizi TaxID=170000 RepID=A0AAV0B4F3_PHAPC|nr:expressed protein [Phakopsora pachyrhizi]
MSERSSLVDYSRSPGLDALAYVSSVELPKFSLNSRNIQNVQANVGPVDRHSSQEAQEEETPDGRVRAYAKLEFPEHDFFIRKLSIIIGRRPPELSRKSNNQADQSDTPTRVEELIDVDLGPIRAVSRKHSKVYFNWHFGAWVLEVLGRNGCVIDGRWKAKGEVVPLRSRYVGKRFFFTLKSMLGTSSYNLYFFVLLLLERDFSFIKTLSIQGPRFRLQNEYFTLFYHKLTRRYDRFILWIITLLNPRRYCLAHH